MLNGEEQCDPEGQAFPGAPRACSCNREAVLQRLVLLLAAPAWFDVGERRLAQCLGLFTAK